MVRSNFGKAACVIAAFLLGFTGTHLGVSIGEPKPSFQTPLELVAQQPPRAIKSSTEEAPPPPPKEAAPPPAAREAPPPVSHHVVHAKIDGPDKADAGDLIVLDGSGSEAAVSRKWMWKHATDKNGKLIPEKTFLVVEGDSKLIFSTGLPGQYTFLLMAVGLDDGKVDYDTATFTVNVGGLVPPPPDPPGPGPGPDPKPPEPKPPTPIPADGLHALILYETDDRDTYSKGQNDVLNSTKIREYLNKKAPGRWRVWDDDIDLTNAAQVWKDVMKQPRSALPWIIVSDGKSGEARAITAQDNEDSILKLLQQYGGP